MGNVVLEILNIRFQDNPLEALVILGMPHFVRTLKSTTS